MKGIIFVLCLVYVAAASAFYAPGKRTAPQEKRVVCGGACIAAGVATVGAAVSAVDTVIGWFKREERRGMVRVSNFERALAARQKRLFGCDADCIKAGVDTVTTAVDAVSKVVDLFGKREIDERGVLDWVNTVAAKMTKLIKDFGLEGASEALEAGADVLLEKGKDAINAALEHLKNKTPEMTAKVEEAAGKAIDMLQQVFEKVEGNLPEYKEYLDGQLKAAIKFAQDALA